MTIMYYDKAYDSCRLKIVGA